MPPRTGFRAMGRAVKEHDPKARGTDNTSVGEYEEGVREPGGRYLMAFCAVTGCSGAWLLTDTGPMKVEPQDVKEARHDLMRLVTTGELDEQVGFLLKGEVQSESGDIIPIRKRKGPKPARRLPKRGRKKLLEDERVKPRPET